MSIGNRQLQILTEEQLDLIEETTFRLLEEVGISLQHDRAMEMLHGLGCRITDKRVYIPRNIVAWALENVGRDSVIRSADGVRQVALGQGPFLTHNMGGAPNILDIYTGKRRLATQQDLADATRLLDALPNNDVIINPISPQDVPDELMNITSFETVLRNTQKPIYGPGAENPDEVRFMIDLAAACCGGMDAFRNHPTVSIYVSPVSPLIFTKKVTGAILAVVEAGVTFNSIPAPSLGATCPITMAGALAQQHAEILASFVIAAAACPGASVTYCSRIFPIDMRSAMPTWGGPEVGLSSMGATQLAHRHGLKCDTCGLSTIASIIDPQLAYEKFANAIMPVLAGTDMLTGVGMMDNGMTASMEVAVIDDEIIDIIHHLLRGYSVNEDTLAFKLMKDVILSDDIFMDQPHTVQHLRDGTVRFPQIGDRNMGNDDLQISVLPQVHDHVLEILKTHEVPPLPDDVQRQLSEIMEYARRQLLPT